MIIDFSLGHVTIWKQMHCLGAKHKVLGKVLLMKRMFLKLTEESINDWQKPLIFKSLTKRIICFWKKFTVGNKTDFFIKTLNFVFFRIELHET